MRSFAYAFCLLGAILVSQAHPQARIVGGDDAVPGQVPYQAGLFIGGTPNCGAVIISEQYVLTAMKCVCSQGKDKPWPPQLFTLTVGSTDLYTGGLRVNVEEITVSPKYSEFDTGIALLKLTKPLVFTDYVKPIALAKVNPPVDTIVEISGWGRIKETDTDMYRSLQLNEATVLSANECSRVLGKSDSQILCLGHARKNGICQGDNGGPAAYDNQLVGLATYTAGECGSFLPDVFISVASYYEWIVQQMS